MTQHASPRWVASKVYIDSIPEQYQESVIEELAFTYPTWFFEILCEFNNEPLVLEDFQIKFLLDDSFARVTNKTRQAGGSMQIALAKMFKAYRNPGYRCDIVSINLKEATDKIKYVRNFWETLPKKYRIPLTIDNALSIGFHKGRNLSTINSLAASAGIRGGKKEVVFDEFAHIMNDQALFEAAAPAIINGENQMDFLSTPRGNLNMFAKMFLNLPNEYGEHPFEKFSRHQFIWCDVRRFVTDYDKAQHAWYVEMQQDMNLMRELVVAYGTDKLKFYYHMFPWDIFKQEFCGVFLDEVGAFFPWSLIERCIKGSVSQASDGKIEYTEDAIKPWVKRPNDNENPVYLGIDFGESDAESDKTSIQILERDLDGILKHRYSEVLTKDQYPDFPAQSAHIAQLAKRFRPERISCDGTGLGRGIVPLLRRMIPDVNVEDVNFNPKTKEEMVMNLKNLMEEDKIWLLAEDTKLHGQIRNIRRDVSPQGTHKYHGEPHDDMFWALALAARGGSYTPFAVYSIGGSRLRLGV